MWAAEQTDGFWYCARRAHRIPDVFLCDNEAHARASAYALNNAVAFYFSRPLEGVAKPEGGYLTSSVARHKARAQ